jgi:glycerophosphoryl diester phosphodiesterase
VRPQNTLFDGKFSIPTLEEVIALAKSESARLGRTIGIYPETKHPTYFQRIGLSLEEPLVRVLENAGLREKDDAVFLRSFEVANLKKLRRMTELPLIQLIDASGAPYDFVISGDQRQYADMVKPEGLAEIARYAGGVGLNKNLIVPRDASGKLLAPTSVVRDAHRRGLLVHSWTFRVENTFLPADFRIGTNPNLRGDLQEELKLFYGLGLDGVFSDNPDVAVATRAGLPGCDR